MDFSWIEIGPTLTGAYLSGGGASTWAARGGAQCDVNFFRNIQANNFIPGVRLLGDYGFSGGSSAGTSDIHPVTYGGDIFMKFFLSSSAVALDFAMGIRRVNSGMPADSSQMTVRQSLGLAIYF